MKELNLTVGQKVWSIQLGDCEIFHKTDKNYDDTYMYLVKSLKDSSITKGYCHDLKHNESDYFQSLFESNPFEKNEIYPEKVEGEWGICSQPENKDYLINALMRVFDCQFLEEETREVAETKLKKLLESL